MFEADNRHIRAFFVLLALEQIVIHFTGANQNAFYVLGFGGSVVEYFPETIAGLQFADFPQVERRAQCRFGRHHDQWFAERPYQLAAQQVKKVAGRSDIGNRHIVFCATLQETFEAGGRVLRALTFVAVRQQHDQAVHTAPFAFPGKDKLVDNGAGAVGEVAELRFPEHQRIGRSQGITVFKTEHGIFGQQRVVDAHFPLLVAQAVEAVHFMVVVRIENAGVAVAERAAFHILTAHAHVAAFEQYRAIG